MFADLAERRELEPALVRAAIASLLADCATPAQAGAFLVGIAAKGPTAAEVAAMVDALLDSAVPLQLGEFRERAIDIVGTGGSKLRQDRAFNISTTSCFVAAGAGAIVCKHGNRRASSSSGSTDVLEMLGVAVELDGPAVSRCVETAGIGFAFARVFHPAMRHVAAVRAELGVPTVFNLLGPLSHPGRIGRHVIGVADPAVAPLVVDTLRRRGATRAMVVHGSDGLDELTLTGPSEVHELRDGEVEVYDVLPQRLGLRTAVVEDLGVGTPEDNATAIREILAGGGGARRDVVLLNTAAGLVVGGLCDDISSGLELAARSIDDGSAQTALETLVSVARPD